MPIDSFKVYTSHRVIRTVQGTLTLWFRFISSEGVATLLTTELYLIYLEMALSNERRSQKHGGFYVTGRYLADKECGVGTSWRGTTPLKQYIVTLGKAH